MSNIPPMSRTASRIAAALALLLATGCGSPSDAGPERGSVARGRELILRHECYDCHLIPGIDRKPGPGVPIPLDGFAERTMLRSTRIRLTREVLEQYLQRPRSVHPPSIMPGIGDRPEDARDIAAYLLTLD